MTIRNIGNLFELAHIQLMNEIEQGKRKHSNYLLKIKQKDGTDKIISLPYKWSDLLKYTIILRKQLDRYGSNGFINKVKNIKTKKVTELTSKKELRHQKYMKEKDLTN